MRIVVTIETENSYNELPPLVGLRGMHAAARSGPARQGQSQRIVINEFLNTGTKKTSHVRRIEHSDRLFTSMYGQWLRKRLYEAEYSPPFMSSYY